MRRPSVVVLLSAVAFTVCVSGHPYSKIPDSIYQLGEGFTSKKSSSSSSSNSFSHENRDNIEINGLHNGQAFAGSKASGYSSNGGSHSSSSAYTSASVSGAIPIGLIHSGASSGPFANSGAYGGAAINSQVGYGALANPGTGSLSLQNIPSAEAINSAAVGYDQSSENAGYGASGVVSSHQAGHGAAGAQYWWMGENSPFAQGAASSSSAGSLVHLGNNKAEGVGIKIQGNPFLQQSSSSGTSGSGYDYGSTSSSSSSGASSSAANQAGAIDASKNPFLSGSGFSGSSSASHGFGSSSVAHGSGSSSVHSSGSQLPSGSGNPFFQQSSHGQQELDFGQQSTGATFPSSSGNQGHVQHPQTSGSEGSSSGGFTVSCNGQSNICVAKHLCSADGYIINKDLTQVRTGPQACDIGSEVCCTLKSSDQTPAGTHSNSHSTIATNFGTGVAQKDGGIFGSANGNHQQTDLNAGEDGLFGGNNQQQESNGYLPPLGTEPSSDVPAFSKPPGNDRPGYDDGDDFSPTNVRPNTIFPPAPAPTPQVGCAAALICVEEQFCTLEGAISNEPVVLSSEQILRRVPLSSCKNPDNGVIGKCCRDLTYVDPWPAGNLPANYSGGFDEQGFPTFLNIAKTRPPKKQPPTSGSVTKGGRPPIKPTFPNRPQINVPPKTPTFPQFPNVPSTPNQIPNNFPNTFRPQTGIHHGQGVNSPAPFPQLPTGSSNTHSVVPNYPTTPSHPNVPNYPHIPSGTKNPSFPIRPQIPNQPNHQGFPNLPHVPQQPNQQSFPNLPQIPQQPKQPGFPTPPQFQNQPNKPAFPTLPHNPNQGYPSQPTFTGVKQTYPTKNHYDTSSTNENPIVIQTHIPGSQCGIRNKVQRPNGLTDADVAFGEIPWQAMILLNTEKKLLCSGAIVARNAVVTAARCVQGFNPSDVSVKAGEWKLGYELKHEEPLPFEIVNVAAIVPYPEYNPGSPANDVAVLILEHDIKLDQHVDLLCLPQGQPQPPQPGRKCISTGWGKTILQVHAAGALMHSIDVDVLSHEQCQQRLNGAESHIAIDGSLVCTKAHRQNNNMCQVDLGGPLACDRGDGHYELVGVYNQDTGCLPTNQVATFATVSPPWVHQMISQPPQVNGGQTITPTHTKSHGAEEPCDCQKSNLPSEGNQYLPPQ